MMINDNGEWWRICEWQTMINDKKWLMTIAYDKQWGMIDNGEWHTNRHDRQCEIADMMDNGE